MIALAAAADGERLVQDCYGDDVGWLDWRRPGFELGLAVRDARRGASSERGDPARRSRAHLLGRDQRRVRGDHARARGTGRAVPRRARSRRAVRRARRWSTSSTTTPDALEAARLGPVARALAGGDRPVVGHFDDSPVVLEFLAHEAAPRLAQLGTSCPDHFLTTKVRPLLLDLHPGAPFEDARRPAARAARAVPRRLRRVLRRARHATTRRRSAATTR